MWALQQLSPSSQNAVMALVRQLAEREGSRDFPIWRGAILVQSFLKQVSAL
jgi:hypothetical protein